MKKLEKSQVQEIVNCMYLKNFKSGEYVIKEGDGGNEMYVLAGTIYFQLFLTYYDYHELSSASVLSSVCQFPLRPLRGQG